jgi:hypothetical protein
VVTRGPGSLRALGGRGKLVFLCHALCVTLSREQPAKLHSKCSVWEPPSFDGSGRVFLRLGLGWRCEPGWSQGPSSGVSSIGSQRLGRALEPWAGAATCSGSARFLCRRVCASVPDGFSPRPILEGSVGGSLQSGTIDPDA